MESRLCLITACVWAAASGPIVDAPPLVSGPQSPPRSMASRWASLDSTPSRTELSVRRWQFTSRSVGVLGAPSSPHRRRQTPAAQDPLQLESALRSALKASNVRVLEPRTASPRPVARVMESGALPIVPWRSISVAVKARYGDAAHRAWQFSHEVVVSERAVTGTADGVAEVQDGYAKWARVLGHVQQPAPVDEAKPLSIQYWSVLMTAYDDAVGFRRCGIAWKCFRGWQQAVTLQRCLHAKYRQFVRAHGTPLVRRVLMDWYRFTLASSCRRMFLMKRHFALWRVRFPCVCACVRVPGHLPAPLLMTMR